MLGNSKIGRHGINIINKKKGKWVAFLTLDTIFMVDLIFFKIVNIRALNF